MLITSVNTFADQYSMFRSKCRVRQTIIKTCCDLRLFQPRQVPSGVYTMRNRVFDTASVYCDMNVTADGGFVQRNSINSSVDYNRNWTDYEKDFGDLTGDFWKHCIA